MRNVQMIARLSLCNGCGTCAAVCPEGAIVMNKKNGILLPDIREDQCTLCSVCVKCCPGHSLKSKMLNLQVFGKQPLDTETGNYVSCYLGHSRDERTRHESSSGGIITQLLVFALDKGLIDGALLVRMSGESPLESQSFIARSESEILSASKSKYCPASLNEGLSEITRSEGRFAVVGLPCHIYGIRQAETLFEELRRKIVLHVGLFCSHTVSHFGTEFLLSKFGIDKREVKRLEYRGKGWPGSMSICLKDNTNLEFRFNRGWNAYWNVFAPFFFTPLHCLMCPDQFNELSDVSVGDAWLPEFRGCGTGQSVIMTRTRTGEEILLSAFKNGAISVRPVSPSRVKDSQAFSLNFKKKTFSGRMRFMKMMGENVPSSHYDVHSNGLLALSEGFLSYFSYRIASCKRTREFLVHFPLPLFRLYFGLFKSLSVLSR